MEASYPREGCGLALGERRGVDVLVREFHPVTNLVHERDRFDLDPGDVVRIDRLGRERGLSIVAVCHSHPDAPAHPSPADARGAWPGMDQVIVEVCGGHAAEVRVYRPRP